MAPHLPQILVARDTSPSDKGPQLGTITILGIVVAAVVAGGLLLWLAIRFYRKRASAKREAERGSAFMTVKGVVREGSPEDQMSQVPPSNHLGVKGSLFSRGQLDSPSVVLPSKAALRPNATRDEIVEHYTTEGKLPRPFAPFMTDSSGPTSSSDKRTSNMSFLSVARNSFLSIGSSSRRFSVASVATTASSVLAATGKRKIQQVFNPVLPDELVISSGEIVTLVNSYDDGWCIIGRDGLGGEVELGAVPAWCFIKPAPGLRAERPMRTTSLGVTINIEANTGPRNEVLSWSNF